MLTDVFLPLIEILAIGIPALLVLTRKLPPADRAFIRRVAFTGFALRLAVATLFTVFPSARVFHEDANGYEGNAQVIAFGWLGHPTPLPIRLSDFGHFSDGSYPGFLGLCSVLIYCFGPLTNFGLGHFNVVITAFTSLCGALSIVLVYRLGAQLFHPAVARRAAVLTAFFPSMILWSAMAIKDPVMILLLLIGLNAVVLLRQRLNVGAVIALALVLCGIWLVRFYVAYFLLVAVAVSLTSFRGRAGSTLRRIGTGILLVGSLSLVGMTGNMTKSFDRMSLEKASIFRYGMVSTAQTAFASDADVSTPMGAFRELPIGVAVLMLGPFPWQMTSMRSALTLPEMLVWWAMLPSLWRGIVFAFRRERSATAPLLAFAATMTLAYALTLGNVGAAFRQRAQVFVFLFLFVALGYWVKRCRVGGMDPGVLRAEEAR